MNLAGRKSSIQGLKIRDKTDKQTVAEATFEVGLEMRKKANNECTYLTRQLHVWKLDEKLNLEERNCVKLGGERNGSKWVKFGGGGKLGEIRGKA